MNEKALKYNSDFLSPESKHSINALPPPPKKNVYIYFIKSKFTSKINGKKNKNRPLYIFDVKCYICLCYIKTTGAWIAFPQYISLMGIACVNLNLLCPTQRAGNCPIGIG